MKGGLDMERIEATKFLKTGNILSDKYFLKSIEGGLREVGIKQIYSRFKNNGTKIYCDNQVLSDLEKYNRYLSVKKDIWGRKEEDTFKRKKCSQLSISNLVIYDIT